MIARGFRIRGRVQGVGFRWWTRSQALRLGLSGSVRNCVDGSVEVQARGEEEAIATLHRLLQEGPPGARVDSIDEFHAFPPADGFSIQR